MLKAEYIVYLFIKTTHRFSWNSISNYLD